MMKDSKIGWTTHSWNPWGWVCNKVSEGCKNCYMFAMAARFHKENPATRSPEWREQESARELRSFRLGDVIFVNSMSDTYSERVPDEYIERVHQTVQANHDKVFLLLTKRPERALALADQLVWPKNLWVGTSVEMEKHIHRLDTLLQLPTRNFFVSAEPLLEALPSLYWYLQPNSTDGKCIEWVIVGGESGRNRRLFDKEWARDIQWMCGEFETPFFFKQGSDAVSGQDRDLDGRTWDETPDWSKYVDDNPTQMMLSDIIPF
ncbi:DUF5131 family protein [Phototrophicus methaneseepsis]|uniref:DUF5131 family protein n=1 Tax=Phototrophicus methaneseepsis TaxID=2710758 RepID=A0A7S8ID00_9CHLR|nr:DUF5131 family protein [Phototrophicus methaneseepsis]QPC81042.1 DUF5131 family protein [Phototrophicus methaneseepsis]